MEHLQTQGISLPKLGLGTFRLQGDACRTAVESALGLGYRHLDTAGMYGNEEPIGAALAAIGRKHNATADQVALKWLLDQDGVAAIPKASRAEKPAGRSRRVEGKTRRRRQDGDRDLAQGPTVCKSGLRAGVGLMELTR
jgi:diketogulonate reductase-like aldo/keto reductase